MEKSIQIAVAKADIVLCSIIEHAPELVIALFAGIFVVIMVARGRR